MPVWLSVTEEVVSMAEWLVNATIEQSLETQRAWNLSHLDLVGPKDRRTEYGLFTY